MARVEGLYWRDIDKVRHENVKHKAPGDTDEIGDRKRGAREREREKKSALSSIGEKEYALMS